MRYIVYGAGAIGGIIGGRLAQHGHDVVLIARGAHLEVLRARGLTLRSPLDRQQLVIPAVGSPAEIAFREGDVAILAMKSQDTGEALEQLVAAAGSKVPVVCAQNGFENERMALRRFENVYAMVVWMPGLHIEPGVVHAESAPISGILDLGRYPSGTDAVAEQVAVDLAGATFSSVADPAIMRIKHAKLLGNLGNMSEAICGVELDDVARAARAEALACFAAAGLECAPRDEFTARRANRITMAPIDGAVRGGGSAWQSLSRATGSIEADWFNGEVALLGRLYGVPTPVNIVLQEVANAMAKGAVQPGAITPDELRERVRVAGGVLLAPR